MQRLKTDFFSRKKAEIFLFFSGKRVQYGTEKPLLAESPTELREQIRSKVDFFVQSLKGGNSIRSASANSGSFHSSSFLDIRRGERKEEEERSFALALKNIRIRKKGRSFKTWKARHTS